MSAIVSRLVVSLFLAICLVASGCATKNSDASRAAIESGSPEVGNWKESGGGSENGYIGELQFFSEGKFSVTYTPVESYRDYWGSYEWDNDTGTNGTDLSLISEKFS